MPETRPVWTRERVEKLHEDYLGGMTLRQIGKANGISYERVRQLFARFDMDSRAVRIDSVRKYARQVEAWERKDEIIDCYKRLGNVVKVSKELDLRTENVSAVVNSFEERSNYRGRGGFGTRGKTVLSDEDLLDAIRVGAEKVGQPLTVSKYTAIAASNSLPAAATISRRFGSWKNACDQAGVKANPAKGPRASSYSKADCLQSIQECAQNRNGLIPSYTAYVKWAKQTGAPSGPTIRNKCGSWSQAIVDAFDEVGFYAQRHDS